MTDEGRVRDARSRKRELLRRKLAESGLGGGSSAGPPIRPRPAGASAPLSAAQRRMWTLQQLDPDGTAYNICAAVGLSGPLDAAAFAAATAAACARHEILHTVYPDGETQVVRPDLAPSPLLVDRTAVPGPARERDLDGTAAEVGGTPFDLGAEAPLRLRLLRYADDEHVLLIVAHHIAWDDASWQVLLGDIAAGYAPGEVCADGPARPAAVPGGAGEPGTAPGTADASGAAPSAAVTPGAAPSATVTPGAAPGASGTAGTAGRVQYADYAIWENGRPAAADELGFWRERLTPLPEPLALPRDRPRPAAPAETGARRTRALPGSVAARLREVARDEGVTPFMLTAAAVTAVLHRHTGSADIALGTPVVDRSRPETAGLIGNFGNTVVLRSAVDGRQTFRGLLGHLRDVCAGAYANTRLPFDRLVTELSPERAAGRPVLFDVLFALRTDVLQGFALPGITARDIPVSNGTAQFELSIAAVLTDDGLLLEAAYRTATFDAATADALLRHTDRLIRAVLDDPGTTVSGVDILGDRERHRILRDFNATAADVPRTTLPALLAEQVAATPAATALVVGHRRLDYAEFGRATDRLAAVLRSAGVGPERIAALLLPRSVELVVGLWSVLKAGGAYLPVDPDYPADRIGYMLADAEPATVLTVAALADRLPHGVPRILLDDLPEDAAGTADAPPARGPDPLHPAYVIYTSGSTGRPKGVVVPHAGIVNRLLWMQDAYRLAPGEPVLQKTPSSFDVSVWEFCWPLITGAALVVARPDGHRDPAYLAELIRVEGVTTVHFVPSMLRAFLADPSVPAQCTGLRRVLCSGEALPADLAAEFHALLPGVELHNLYGPTEASVDVTSLESVPGRAGPTVPIGRPVWNTAMYVLGPDLAPVPPGAAGELYIAGVQLARAYLGRPGLTAERFTADPFGPPGARMYRTGDIARFDRDGVLEYLGRADDQVKLRGLRIELGEIEAVLGGHPRVAAAAAAVRDGRLVGYLVGDGAEHASVREHAAAALPEYMVPAAFVGVGALPLSPSGKLDRKRLASAPEFAPAAAAGPARRAPATDRERLLCSLFAEVLRLPEVGADDRFFSVGGDSIQAISLVGRSRAAGLEFSAREVFEQQTPAGLAAVARDAATTAVHAADGTGLVPATPIMEWLRGRGPDIGRFSQTVVVRTPAGASWETMAAAVQRLLDHHDALRARLDRTGAGPWRLDVAPAGRVDAASVLRRADAGGLTAEALAAAVDAQADAAEEELDPDAGAVLRLRWLDTGPHTAGRLVCTGHHLVVDGVSWRILLADLATAYTALASGREPVLAPVPTSLRGHALRLSDRAALAAARAAATPAATRTAGAAVAPAEPGAVPPSVTSASGIATPAPVPTSGDTTTSPTAPRHPDGAAPPPPAATTPTSTPERTPAPSRSASADTTPASGSPPCADSTAANASAALGGGGRQRAEGAPERVPSPPPSAPAGSTPALSSRRPEDPAGPVSPHARSAPPGAMSAFGPARPDVAGACSTSPPIAGDTPVNAYDGAHPWGSSGGSGWRDDGIGAVRALDPERDTAATTRRTAVTLPPDRTAPLLDDVPAALRTGVEEVLLTALVIAAADRRRHRGGGGGALTVDLEGHGRDGADDLSRTVGWFTVLHPVRLDPGPIDADEAISGGPAAGRALRRVKEALAASRAGAAEYGLLRYLAPRSGPPTPSGAAAHHPTPSDAAARPPAPEVGFNYLGRFGTAGADWDLAGGDGALRSGADPGLAAAHALEVDADVRDHPDGPRLSVTWSWPAGVVADAEVEALAEAWTRALAALTAHAARGTAGLTPSDVPLTGLDQIAIDELTSGDPAVADILPLTPLAEGLLYHAETDPGAYIVQFAVDLSGPVDLGELRRCVQEVLHRHPVLRGEFRTAADGRSFMVVKEGVADPLRTAGAGGAAELAALEQAERERPFAVATAPLLRFVLVRTGTDTHRLVLTCHHLLIDGWSLALLARELLWLYGRAGGLPPAPAPHAHLAWLASRDTGAAAAAWASALSGAAPTLVAARPADRVPDRISAEVADAGALTAVCAERGWTVNTLLQSAWGLLLATLTGRDDVLFGTAVAGRPAELPGSGSMVGLFTNTVPVRVRLRPDETAAGLVDRLQREQAALLDHHHLGLADIQRAAGLDTLFDTLLVFENYPGAGLETGGGPAVTGVHGRDATHYPLALTVVPRGDRLTVLLDHRGPAFDAGAARLVLDRFLELLAGLAADADRPVPDLDPWSGDDPERVAPARPLTPARGGGPAASGPDHGSRAARDPREEIVRTHFADVLGAAAVGPDDDFFALGGHSLLAIRLVTRLRAALDADVPMAAVFDGRTPARVAAALGRARPDAAGPLARTAPGIRAAPDEAVPLSSAQQRLWFLHRLEGPSPAYNIAAARRLSGPLDEPALRAALADTVARHPALRTVFPMVDGVARQVVREAADTGLEVRRTSAAALDADLAEAARHPFVLAAETPMRATLFTLAPDEHVLLVVVHHIAGDGWSFAPLLRDLGGAYAARLRGRAPGLPDLPARYADYAVWQRGLLGEDGAIADAPLAAQAEYWRTALAGLPAETPLPADRPRPPETAHAGGLAEFAVDPGLAADVRSTAVALGVSPFMVWQAALAALLTRAGAGTDVPIGTPVAGRTDPAFDDVVGLFVNTLVLRTDTSGDPTARDLLGRVRRTALSAYDHQELPFEAVVDLLNPPRSVARHPLFQVMLAYQNTDPARLDLPGLRVRPLVVRTGVSAVDLTFTVVDDPEQGMAGFVEYSTDLFDPETARALGEGLTRLLRAMTADVDAPLSAWDPGPLPRHRAHPPAAVPGPQRPAEPAAPSAAGGPAADAGERLRGVFAEVLKVPEVGPDDGFFELGGDSIASIRMVGRARAAGLLIDPKDVFRHRTPAALAAVAVPLAAGPDTAGEPQGAALGTVPETPIMAWLRERGGPIGGFSQAMAVHVPPAAGGRRLALALQAVLDHHDALRARLVRGDRWSLEVPPPGAVSAHARLRRVPAEGDPAEQAAAEADRARSGLDPDAGRMVQAVWIDAGPDTSGLLVLVVHHLVVDGVSWRILLPDLRAAWETGAVESRSGTSLRGWSRALNTRADRPAALAQLPAWTAVHAGAVPLPIERAPDPDRDTAATTHRLTLTLEGSDATALHTAAPDAFRGGMDDVLLAGLALAVREWAGGAPGGVLIDREGHGRDPEPGAGSGTDVSGTVGWFTAVSPVRLDPGPVDPAEARAGGRAAGDAVKAVKEQLRTLPAGAHGYGLLRHLNPETAPGLAAADRPLICFNYLGRLAIGTGADPWSATGYDLPRGADPGLPARYAIEVDAVTRDLPGGPELVATWSWPEGVVRADAVRALAEGWFAHLRGVAEHARRPEAGGRTPSDLGLVSLSQDEIDEFEAEWTLDG
ncbi:amino acid adenylation domain-containing protein [Nocardiopsis mangrovi]|uniref:Amino acid adenylation domain-containing protein n=1 Tax=Nocardiopsis mangrovi TaxID=1179818 RepID=A0ABV9E3M3_9ACTN